jgi:hypothetical protein
MKILQWFMIGLLSFTLGCKDGYIDDIDPVKPDEDTEAPEVEINYPLEGTLIRVVEDVTSITFDLEVVDDVEIESITLQLDGSDITTMSEFKDYRRALEEYTYDNLTNGPHTFTVVAEDMSGKTTSESVDFEKVEPYKPIYDGEIFYMPFDGDFLELVTLQSASENGNPGFTTNSVAGTAAYEGAEGAYLTFPTDGLTNEEFSAVFWYKLNVNPDRNRAGILVVGPPYPSPPETLNNGFKLFREAAGSFQRFKLIVGDGSANYRYVQAGPADLDPTVVTDWVHMAITIGLDSCKVYIDGQVVQSGEFPGPIGWNECEIMSIMSGAPNYTHWNHLSDHSQMDELRIFNKALTQEEIQMIISDES